MPPRVRFTREEIVSAAFGLARVSGLEGVNARAVAKALGASTQPLFRVFSSMEEIRSEVIYMAWAAYRARVSAGAASADRPYRGTGMAYIRFAREEPELFKILFMRDRVRDGTMAEDRDDTLDQVLDALVSSTGLSRESARAFHMHMWIYVHGIATMIATNFLVLSDEEIDRLLREDFFALRAHYGVAAVPSTPPARD